MPGLPAASALRSATLRRLAADRFSRSFYAGLHVVTGANGPRFMNLGLAPVDPAAAGPERHQATLALAVLRAGEAALGRKPTLLVDVACGRGGTTELAAGLYPAATIMGLDLQWRGLRVARRHGTLAAAADGRHLPIGAGRVDLLLSIEAMMVVARPPFLAEAARVLAPGGVLAVTGTYGGTPAETEAVLRAEAGCLGLEIASLEDITAGVVRACEADAGRRRQWLPPVPWLRGWVAKFCALPGSETFNLYATGRRCYYLASFRRLG